MCIVRGRRRRFDGGSLNTMNLLASSDLNKTLSSRNEKVAIGFAIFSRPLSFLPSC